MRLLKLRATRSNLSYQHFTFFAVGIYYLTNIKGSDASGQSDPLIINVSLFLVFVYVFKLRLDDLFLPFFLGLLCPAAVALGLGPRRLVYMLGKLMGDRGKAVGSSP